MRIVIGVVALLLLAGAGLAAGSASAAPANSNGARVLTLDCPGGDIQVLINFDSSASSVFDPGGSGGRAYLLQSLDVRAYAGDLAVEPSTVPDFAFQKQWGNRLGYSQTMECQGRTTDNFGETFTFFFDVAITSK